MGEVYRARDPQLERDVAIKILSEGFALDAERLQRFRREAQTLAALNHPHIAQVYGFDDTGEIHSLVMELVEGEDLTARISRGPIPVDESVSIATQIADALEAAHEQGIIHRDLKPANVKVRADGSVKVLDFGLAKALIPAATADGTALANSPTMATPAMTTPGVLLGTAAYMSPEQARGKEVDKRTDVWAFGVVLFEMLTGRCPFHGETVTDVLSAVISGEPDWNSLPASIPERLSLLLRRCLEKNPRFRLRDIGEARIALASTVPAGPMSGTASPATPSLNAFARGLPWVVAAISLAVAGSVWFRSADSQSPDTRRFETSLPKDGSGFALAPDGRSLAYFQSGQLRLTDLRRWESRDLASAPPGARRFIFWSPDSTFVAFSTPDGNLWKVPVSGGTPLLVCPIPESRSLMGGTWRTDQSIVFAVWRGSLYTVPASGGTPVRLLARDTAQEVDFHNPIALPDGRILVTTHLNPTNENQSSETTRVELVDGQQRETVLGQGFTPVGYLRDGRLLAQRFDVNVGLWMFPYAGRGPLRPEDGRLVAANAENATAAQEGTLLYSLSAPTVPSGSLVWFDRTGHEAGHIGGAVPELMTPALAPDGRRVAFSAQLDRNKDIWIRDVQGTGESRLTFEAGDEVMPAWFPKGERLAYAELRGIGLNRVASRTADGSGPRHELSTGFAPVVSHDGRTVLYLVDESGSLHVRYADVLRDGGLGPARRVFDGAQEPNVESVSLSPDGHLLAYAEKQANGGTDVFMTQFPSGAGRWQISRAGGSAPVWVRSTGELIFIGGRTGSPRQLMASSIRQEPSVAVIGPSKLFDIAEGVDTLRDFDVTSDGKRFLMVKRVESGIPSTRWVVTQNWTADVGSTR
jgi:serine/threonine protein kinase